MTDSVLLIVALIGAAILGVIVGICFGLWAKHQGWKGPQDSWDRR